MLRADEVGARNAKRLLVVGELALDVLQLLSGELIAVVRLLRARIKLLQLTEDALRLGPFGR